jgi:hypothetical protein
MSSCSRIWSERHPVRAAALLVALVAALWPGPAAALAPAPPSAGVSAGSDRAAVPLPISAVRTDGRQTSLVVDLGGSTGAGRPAASVTYAGLPAKARIVPVMSDDLAVALVVDSSAAGAATLPAWLSAAARFVLEAPARTQAVVIADTAPASVVTRPQRGAAETIRVLNAVRAGGERDTAAALTLATRQFPGAPPGRRLVVLYTTATDAGESAAVLGARFLASGTMLVVVGTAEGDRYWTEVAAATGGFFAPAGNPVVGPALDQVQTTLAGRHLIEFPTPPALPARVAVRVDTGDLTLTGEAVVGAAPPALNAAPDEPGARIAVPWGPVLAGLLAVAAVALLVVLRGSPERRDVPGRAAGEPPPAEAPPSEGRSPVGRPPGTEEPLTAYAAVPPPAAEGPPAAWAPPTARGRVAMPGEVARGRATVPRTFRGRGPAAPAGGGSAPPAPRAEPDRAGPE